MHKKLITTLLAFAAMSAGAQEVARHNDRPPQGYVPDQVTAIKIAVAVWEPIYGKERIAHETPYVVRLSGDTWIVEGSLPPSSVGGVATAEISKKDGRVLRVSHGQ
jgi:hypothetical protein